jgi:hypothetical protein
MMRRRRPASGGVHQVAGSRAEESNALATLLSDARSTSCGGLHRAAANNFRAFAVSLKPRDWHQAGNLPGEIMALTTAPRERARSSRPSPASWLRSRADNARPPSLRGSQDRALRTRPDLSSPQASFNGRAGLQETCGPSALGWRRPAPASPVRRAAAPSLGH